MKKLCVGQILRKAAKGVIIVKKNEDRLYGFA